MMNTIRFCVALVLVLGFSGRGEASEPCCEMGMAPAGQPLGVSRPDEQAIVRAIEGYAEGFIHKDLRKLLGLWDDKNAAEVSYGPVEMDPIVGLSNLRSYYLGFFGTLNVVSGDVTDVQIFPLGGDLVYVFCHFDWVYAIGGGQNLEQQTRATFVLRKRASRWYYEHFHESVTFQP